MVEQPAKMATQDFLPPVMRGDIEDGPQHL